MKNILLIAFCLLTLLLSLPSLALAHGKSADHDLPDLQPPPGPVAVELEHGTGHDNKPSAHHVMTHPFLTHMGIPDGPREVSMRFTGIQRSFEDISGTDFAFHIEAGIVERLGLHLRNDSPTSAGKRTDEEMEDHGTELMLMYSLLQDDAATRGLSIFLETAAPTVRGDGPFLRYGAGLGGRYIFGTRLQWDAIVHVSPEDDQVEFEYESSVVVRFVDRIFGVVETSGGFGMGDFTNYILVASKVGLGQSHVTAGVGMQFATTTARTYDRQAMLQLDFGF